jgi:hypothetical protein
MVNPSNILQIILGVVINDLDYLKQEYLIRINSFVRESVLYSINTLSSEEIELEYGKYFERIGIFFDKIIGLSEADFRKLLNETRLLSIEIELFNHEEDGVVCFCSGYLIDPFMNRWCCAIQSQYNHSEDFIDNG